MNSPKILTATGTIRVARFVTIDSAASNSVKESVAGDLPAGISQLGSRSAPLPSETTNPANAAIAGESVNVFSQAMQCLLEIGSGGCNAGDLIKPTTGGVGIKLAGSGLEKYGARALEAGASGNLVKVEVLVGHITTP